MVLFICFSFIREFFYFIPYHKEDDALLYFLVKQQRKQKTHYVEIKKRNIHHRKCIFIFLNFIRNYCKGIGIFVVHFCDIQFTF